MTAFDEVATLDRRIHRVGSTLLFAPEVLAHAQTVGLEDPVLLYAGGRGGVLGDVSWEQICSAFAFFPPDFVQSTWAEVETWGDPRQIAQHYADGFGAYGRAVFPEEAAEVFADRAAQVVDSVTLMGFSLFAGWRHVPRPAEARARAAVLLTAMRELRGDIHVQEIASEGLQPLEAEIVVRGFDGIGLHGWQPPYPDPAPLRERVERATAATTRRMEHLYRSALQPSEFDEMCRAAEVIDDAVRGASGG